MYAQFSCVGLVACPDLLAGEALQELVGGEIRVRQRLPTTLIGKGAVGATRRSCVAVAAAAAVA